MNFRVSNLADITLTNKYTGEIVFTGKTIAKVKNQFGYGKGATLESTTVTAVKIEDGLKIDVRESILQDIQRNTYIQDNYNLTIKRLNRWWWNVYFERKNI